MRTLRRTVDSRTFFIITDVEPAYVDVLRGLLYPVVPGGFGRAFPTDTPHLDHIYRNFELYAEEMVLQAARVHPVPWEKTLLAFLQLVEQQGIDWWLTGSAALSVRGMAIEPGDLDLAVAGLDARRLGDILLDYLYEPVVLVENWISDWFGRAFLRARIEWAGGVNARADTPQVSDFGPTAQRRLETVMWHKWEIRVPPLDLQLRVTERRGLAERAEMIRRFMRQNA